MSEKKQLDDSQLQEVSGGTVSLFDYGKYLTQDRIVDGQYQFTAGDGKWYTLAPQHAAKFDSPESTQAWMHKEAGKRLSHTKLGPDDVIEVAS